MSERLEYIQQLEGKIATTKSELARLKTDKEKAVQTMQHEEIENLEKYLEEANVSLKDISLATEDAWQELRDAIEELMGKVAHSLKGLMGDSEDSSHH